MAIPYAVSHRKIGDVLRAILWMALFLVPGFASSQSIYPAENALLLASKTKPKATQVQTVRAIHQVFAGLKLSAELQARYAYMGSAKFQIENGYFETTELEETVLVANGAVKVGFVRNSVIIARGDVDIAHGGGLVVIADGSINLSHESGVLGVQHPPGVYVARRKIDIGHGIRPVVYAVKGARVGYSGQVSAINTDIQVASGVQATKTTVAAIFSAEPVRTPAQSSLLVNSGESIPYGGRRCDAPLQDDVNLFQRLLPYARREANCPRIRSAAVNCEQQAGPNNHHTAIERWTFELCDRKLQIDSGASGRIPSVVSSK